MEQGSSGGLAEMVEDPADALGVVRRGDVRVRALSSRAWAVTRGLKGACGAKALWSRRRQKVSLVLTHRGNGLSQVEHRRFASRAGAPLRSVLGSSSKRDPPWAYSLI
jgi:hypothetical protein